MTSSRVKCSPSTVLQGIAWTFNVAYLILAFAIPLQAESRHWPVGVIVILTAAPGVVLLVQRFLSGPLADGFGELPVLRIAIALGVLSGLVPWVWGSSFVGLLLAQIVSGSMRGLFWTAAQSYIMGLGSESTTVLGRFTGAANFGGLVGILVTGSLAQYAGFPALFGLVAVLQVCACGAVSLLPPSTRPPSGQPIWGAVAGVPSLFRLPVVGLAGGIALLAAIPQALVQSFYPVYLFQMAHSMALASVVTALRNVGTIVGSYLAGTLFAAWGHRVVMAGSLGGLAIGLALTSRPMGAPSWVVALGLLVAGFCSAVVTVLYVSLSGLGGLPGLRASTMAAVSLFWSGTMFGLPIVFGSLTQWRGMATAFQILAAVVMATAIPLWRSRSWGQLPPLAMGHLDHAVNTRGE